MVCGWASTLWPASDGVGPRTAVRSRRHERASIAVGLWYLTLSSLLRNCRRNLPRLPPTAYVLKSVLHPAGVPGALAVTHQLDKNLVGLRLGPSVQLGKDLAKRRECHGWRALPQEKGMPYAASSQVTEAGFRSGQFLNFSRG